MGALVSLHWVITAATNDDQRQLFGWQLGFASTLAA
jgi:hypothetical protein